MSAAAGPARFPWQRIIAAGLQRFSPREFWSLTLPELQMLFAPPERERPSRGDLDALMCLFPDPQRKEF